MACLALKNQFVDLKGKVAEPHPAENMCACAQWVHLCKPLSASGRRQMHSYVDLWHFIPCLFCVLTAVPRGCSQVWRWWRRHCWTGEVESQPLPTAQLERCGCPIGLQPRLSANILCPAAGGGPSFALDHSFCLLQNDHHHLKIQWGSRQQTYKFYMPVTKDPPVWPLGPLYTPALHDNNIWDCHKRWVCIMKQFFSSLACGWTLLSIVRLSTQTAHSMLWTETTACVNTAAFISCQKYCICMLNMCQRSDKFDWTAKSTLLSSGMQKGRECCVKIHDLL